MPEVSRFYGIIFGFTIEIIHPSIFMRFMGTTKP